MTNRKRNQVIALRVTSAERRRVNARVRQSGLSQQEYLLKAALGQPVYVVEELKPILSELRAWGRNLNQLTVLAHEGRIQAVSLRETMETLGRTYDAVNALLTERNPVVSCGDVQFH